MLDIGEQAMSRIVSDVVSLTCLAMQVSPLAVSHLFAMKSGCLTTSAGRAMRDTWHVTASKSTWTEPLCYTAIILYRQTHAYMLHCRQLRPTAAHPCTVSSC